MEVNFNFTADKAQPIALSVHKHYRRAKKNVVVEERIEGAPYRPTLTVSGPNAATMYIDVHATAAVPRGLEDFARWCGARRDYAQVWLATSDQASIAGTVMTRLKEEGIGLILVSEEENLVYLLEARIPALMVTPEPNLAFGHKKGEVGELVERFNRGDRKASLQDMCELVEQQTDALARKAARKKVLNKAESDVAGMSWANQLDVLAALGAYTPGSTPLVTPTLKSDLDSFRGARNLIDHKVRTKKEKADREKQFTERMMTGPRLVAELLRLQRKV